MPSRFKTLAIAAALAAGTSGVAMAQGYGYTYTCPAGYVFANGVCRPVGPGGVVSGTVGAAGAVAGGAVGAAGAIAGGALDAAGNIVGGTVGAVTGAPPAYYGSSYPPGYAPNYNYGR